MIITQIINMNLDEHGVPPRIDAMQGDAYTRRIELNLFSGAAAWEIPADAQTLVRFQKPDGHCGAYDTLPDGTAACSVSGSTVSVVLLPQMLTTAGLVRMHVSLVRDITVISTFEILIQVNPNVGAEITESEDYYNVGGFLPMPVHAAVGEYIRVADTDERGIVKAVETAGLEDANVPVPESRSFDLTGVTHTVSRCSFYVGTGPISLEEYSGYRINRIGVMASPGSTVRFALFAVKRNADNTGVLTKIAVIGDAVADAESGFASLTPAGGFLVERDNTLIMALAEKQVIRCHQEVSSLQMMDLLEFDDGNYFAAGAGTEVACSFTTEETADPSDIWVSLCTCDMDFIRSKALQQYIADTARQLEAIDEKAENLLPVITVLDNGKVLAVVDGVYQLADISAGGGIPPATADDEGKFLRVVNGAATWAAIACVEEASF